MITIMYRFNENISVGGLIIKGGGVLNRFEESKWDKVYRKYKRYFDKRIQNDKNPNGVFIISGIKEKAQDQLKEAGEIKIDVDERINEIIDETIKDEAPELLEAHKENKKAQDQLKEAGEIKIDVDERINEIIDETIKDEAPELLEAHKENKKAQSKTKK